MPKSQSIRRELIFGRGLAPFSSFIRLLFYACTSLLEGEDVTLPYPLVWVSDSCSGRESGVTDSLFKRIGPRLPAKGEVLFLFSYVVTNFMPVCLVLRLLRARTHTRRGLFTCPLAVNSRLSIFPGLSNSRSLVKSRDSSLKTRLEFEESLVFYK